MLERTALEMLKAGFHVGNDQRTFGLMEVFENTTHGGMSGAVSARTRLMRLNTTDHQQCHAIRSDKAILGDNILGRLPHAN